MSSPSNCSPLSTSSVIRPSKLVGGTTRPPVNGDTTDVAGASGCHRNPTADAAADPVADATRNLMADAATDATAYTQERGEADRDGRCSPGEAARGDATPPTRLPSGTRFLGEAARGKRWCGRESPNVHRPRPSPTSVGVATLTSCGGHHSPVGTVVVFFSRGKRRVSVTSRIFPEWY
jgi:hypothetical protein